MKGFFSSSEIEKGKPASLVPRCGACALYKQCSSPKMRPYGKGRLKVLVVGEAPGEQEDEEGRPFIGKAGQLLRDTLEHFDVDLDEDALTTNALICHPPGNATPNNKQIEWCRPNILKTIQSYQPHVVITLGRSALASVLSGYWKSIEKLERWVGWRIPLEDFWLCPTYHPSYLGRINDELINRRFAEHLKRAFSIDRNSIRQPDWKRKIEILYDEAQICKALQQFDRHSEWIAVDYETNCLKPEYPKAKIFSCAISDGKRTISYPWIGEAIKYTGRLLKSGRTLKIASNLKMEEKWTRFAFGHGVCNWGWDTMIAAHCLDNRPGICSIKFQSLIRLGVPAYNEHIEPFLYSSSWYNRIHHIEMNQLLLYGGMDAILEFKVAMKQRKEMGF